MPIDITIPFEDETLDDEKINFLKNLQANILKGHGREHVALVFLKIKNVHDARDFLRDYPVTSSFVQFNEVEEFKKNNTPGGIVRLVFISKSGLDVLGHGNKFSTEQPFASGMSQDTSVLDHGEIKSWQIELAQHVHVLLLIAYHDESLLMSTVGDLVSDFGIDNSPFEVLYVQEGKAYKNSDGEGLEHFGYVDGRSQPLMLKSQIAAEDKHRRGGLKKYNPSAPLKQFLVPDPLSSSDFGSYFVFRKLEQNVSGFKKSEDDLGEEVLKLQGADQERAGAMVVGRFEDGTPLTLSDREISVPVINNFNYDDDDGAKCPFHAHIRKSNPRGLSPGGLEFDKSVQMARRGITYGTRLQHPDTKEFIDTPENGVGLLFMSYQASIANQFQFMQSQWINNPNFPHENVGIDPIIGQSASEPIEQTWVINYGKHSATKKSLFKGFVTLKGGEYFFTPSINGLKTI